MPTPIRTSDLLGQTPAPVQLQVLGSNAFELGLITGFASGKTRGICAATMQHGIKWPQAKILLGRKTYPEMRDTVKQPWFSMAEPLYRGGWIVKPKNWDYREGTNHVQLINGSQFFFSNFDDPLKFRNEEYTMVAIDQAEETTEEIWELILGRIRHAAVPSHAWQAIASANDNGHNWMWRRFVHDLQDMARNPLRCTASPLCVFLVGHPDEDGTPRPYLPCSTRQFFHGTTLDNAHNLSRLYLANLLSKPKEWQRHFIYATMEGGAGRLLPDPTVTSHFDPPSHWPRYRAIDHALNSPCCCLWLAVNPDSSAYKGVNPGSPYVYREYWQDASSVDQHCERILRLSRGESILVTVIDKSAFRRDQSRQDGVLISIADLYTEFGLFTIPSQGDPYPRVERIVTCHNKGMIISDACKHLIRSFPEYYADLSRTDGNYTIKNRSTFHAIDALGYGLMAVPQNMNAMLEAVHEIPDYLKPENIGKMSPGDAFHHKREFRRIQAIQQSHQLDQDGYAADTIPATEFWGEGMGKLDENLEVAPYSPFGRDE